jgi:arylsulfatase
VVATGKQANSISFLQVADETFDVGDDLRTELNAKDYHLPFPFDGKIDKLSVHLGPMQLEPADQTKAGEAKVKSSD